MTINSARQQCRTCTPPLANSSSASLRTAKMGLLPVGASARGSSNSNRSTSRLRSKSTPALSTRPKKTPDDLARKASKIACRCGLRFKVLRIRAPLFTKKICRKLTRSKIRVHLRWRQATSHSTPRFQSGKRNNSHAIRERVPFRRRCTPEQYSKAGSGEYSARIADRMVAGSPWRRSASLETTPQSLLF